MLAVNIYSVHGELGGVLLDISRGGAMVNASPPLPVGCRLVIERRNLEIPGTVRWVEGNRFGIQFEDELDEIDLMAIVSKGRQQNDAA